MQKKQEYVMKSSQVSSTCHDLNLNTDSLNIETLMGNPTYRRLCNIVKNDVSRSDLSFRKNLIKELYFLLQMAPIIKTELKDHFLAEVEKWYDLNDHKKINLASNKLNNLLSIVHHSKTQSNHSGIIQKSKNEVVWNEKVSPFLRPYTAQRSNCSSKGNKLCRPESSKFGTRSTKVDTNDDIFIRQFTTNIQQQLQINQDYLQKHRTNHPEYEPTYEQLYSILKKVQTHSNMDKQNQQAETFRIPQTKCTRYSRSALPRQQEYSTKSTNFQLAEHINPNGEPSQAQNEEKDSQSNSSSDGEQQILYVSENKKQEVKYHEQKVDKVITNEQKIYDDTGLYKYAHCVQNKLIQALREDRGMAKKYVQFARVKTAMKRQLNRKNQSRRLLSAKDTGKHYKFSNSLSENKEDNSQFTKFYDLTKDPLNVEPDKINSYPTYNKKQFLKKRYEGSVPLFKKLNKSEDISEKVKNTVKRPMTAFIRFHSPIRFDPMSEENTKKYNQQVLQEIEKIKMKMGNKCAASTDSLMKALYVDIVPPSQDFKWTDQNPFYGMISKGKKLKKKGRRGKSKTKVQNKK